MQGNSPSTGVPSEIEPKLVDALGGSDQTIKGDDENFTIYMPTLYQRLRF